MKSVLESKNYFLRLHLLDKTSIEGGFESKLNSCFDVVFPFALDGLGVEKRMNAAVQVALTSSLLETRNGENWACGSVLRNFLGIFSSLISINFYLGDSLRRVARSRQNDDRSSIALVRGFDNGRANHLGPFFADAGVGLDVRKVLEDN